MKSLYSKSLGMKDSEGTVYIGEAEYLKGYDNSSKESRTHSSPFSVLSVCMSRNKEIGKIFIGLSQ